ncbi:MAG: bifunctional N(6)-L-threonylcarbamoyladenine synthase/serine/threonine protein kinase [Candidatus Aenigmarchaeota archaeon]|nr:bifunctional N(6)-L-threonylcarbamoyladenine synthase/serine/threonine protein kinase [Candidatus Aenigmarchaeota archaeon]
MFRHRKYCTLRVSRNTFGVGIVTEEGKILSDERFIYVPPLGRGIHPREATEYHLNNAQKVLKRVLKESELKMSKIDLISFSRGPGLPNCLQVGSSIARYLSLKHKIPLLGVSHCVSHIEIGRLLTKCKDPVIVYCSGGNSQIIAYIDGKYRVMGETTDIPIGNAFDVLARELGLEMPGGPKIEELAKTGKWVDLPYVVKGMDLSFTGIVTECIKKLNEGIRKEDVCYSFQETVFSMLTEVTERALAHTNKSDVLLVGGVAASRRLSEMMKIMCREREVKSYTVPKEYSADNGVMIAWNGILAFTSGQRMKLEDTTIIKNWRIDDVDITWL